MLLGIKIPDANNRIVKKFGVPYNTVLGWSKKNDLGDWRMHLYDRLKTYSAIEEYTLEEIRKIINNTELKILITSLNGTMTTQDLIREGYLAIYVKETLLYESWNVTQFLEDAEDAEIYINALSSKLKELKVFELFVLVEFCINFWEQKEQTKDLDMYLKNIG